MTPLQPPPLPAPASTQASALKPTFDKHLDAIKWVIALPVAILFGTTQLVDKIDFAKHTSARPLLLLIIIANAAGVFASVIYYFVAIRTADQKLLGKPTSATLERSAAVSFLIGTVTVTFGFLFAVVGVILYPRFALEKTPAPPTSPVIASHYSISVSGPVRDRRGTHVHTFLVNDSTGEVWRLDCGGSSGIQFLRVPVQDLPHRNHQKSTSDLTSISGQ